MLLLQRASHTIRVGPSSFRKKEKRQNGTELSSSSVPVSAQLKVQFLAHIVASLQALPHQKSLHISAGWYWLHAARLFLCYVLDLDTRVNWHRRFSSVSASNIGRLYNDLSLGWYKEQLLIRI